MRKPIEHVRSGEQIVTENGSWDRVHAVSEPDPFGVVTVDSDHSRSSEFAEYRVGTMVDIV